jgi:ABC-2 type transport system permease protein
MNVQLRMRTLNLFIFGTIITQPVIFSAVGYFLARSAGRTSIDFLHTIIGSGVMGLWSTMLFSCFYDLRTDRREGTLEIFVGSPTSIFSILAIRAFTNVLLGSSSFLLALIFAMSVFGFSIPAGNLPYFIVSLLILFFAFWCLGIFLAHWPIVSRLSPLFINYLELPIAIITGFMFPVSLLPLWAQWLSRITPMSWAFNNLSMSIQPGLNVAGLAANWLITLGIALIYLVGTFFMSGQVQNMIRVTGELSSV